MQSVPFKLFFHLFKTILYLELHNSSSLLEFWQSIFIKLLEIFIGFFVIILNKEKEKEEITTCMFQKFSTNIWQILAVKKKKSHVRQSQQSPVLN